MLMSLCRSLGRFGADPAVINLNQVLRVPGYLNTKRLPEQMVKMLQVPTLEEVEP